MKRTVDKRAKSIFFRFVVKDNRIFYVNIFFLPVYFETENFIMNPLLSYTNPL